MAARLGLASLRGYLMLMVSTLSINQIARAERVFSIPLQVLEGYHCLGMDGGALGLEVGAAFIAAATAATLKVQGLGCKAVGQPSRT